MNRVARHRNRTGMLGPVAGSSHSELHGTKAKAVRNALEDCPEEFTIYNVEDVLKAQRDPPLMERVSISQALHDFARSGEIFIKTPSYGRRAAIYCKSRPVSRHNVADVVMCRHS